MKPQRVVVSTRAVPAPRLGETSVEQAKPRPLSRVWRFLQVRPVHDVLDLDEYCRFVARLHWMSVVRTIVKSPGALIVTGLLSLMVSVVAPTAWPVLLVLWLLAMSHQCYLVYQIMLWRIGFMMITDKRLVRSSGVLTLRVASTNLHRITDAEYHQSVLGRLLGYGTLRVESGGRHDDGATREYIKYVPEPALAHRMLTPPSYADSRMH